MDTALGRVSAAGAVQGLSGHRVCKHRVWQHPSVSLELTVVAEAVESEEKEESSAAFLHFDCSFFKFVQS
jgi:hypothetical protein